ncbi:MAG: hypothetical protein M1814_003601 [Vezdaea aestivalis]|nr:MAG: hypothetical protein M1814_003601 [Vezdaea aestivalis]
MKRPSCCRLPASLHNYTKSLTSSPRPTPYLFLPLALLTLLTLTHLSLSIHTLIAQKSYPTHLSPTAPITTLTASLISLLLTLPTLFSTPSTITPLLLPLLNTLPLTTATLTTFLTQTLASQTLERHTCALLLSPSNTTTPTDLQSLATECLTQRTTRYLHIAWFLAGVLFVAGGIKDWVDRRAIVRRERRRQMRWAGGQSGGGGSATTRRMGGGWTGTLTGKGGWSESSAAGTKGGKSEVGGEKQGGGEKPDGKWEEKKTVDEEIREVRFELEGERWA